MGRFRHSPRRRVGPGRENVGGVAAIDEADDVLAIQADGGAHLMRSAFPGQAQAWFEDGSLFAQKLHDQAGAHANPLAQVDLRLEVPAHRRSAIEAEVEILEQAAQLGAQFRRAQKKPPVHLGASSKIGHVHRHVEPIDVGRTAGRLGRSQCGLQARDRKEELAQDRERRWRYEVTDAVSGVFPAYLLGSARFGVVVECAPVVGVEEAER